MQKLAHIHPLHSQGSSPGLRSPIRGLPGGLFGVLCLLGLLNVLDPYELLIWVDSHLLSSPFGSDFIKDDFLTYKLYLIKCLNSVELLKTLRYLSKCYLKILGYILYYFERFYSLL